MPPKKGKKPAPAKKAAADDDWDILNELAPAPAPVEAPAAPAPDAAASASKDDDVEDAVAAHLASLGISASAAADKKKKKKGKKKGDDAKEPGAAAAAPPAPAGPKKPLSAAAKALQERQAALKAEQERLKAIQEEEERLEREAEARRLEEIRKKEEAAERKRLAKKAKVEAAKAEGTYMTKAQKLKAQRAQAALEAMKAQGLVTVAAEEAADEEKKPVVYTNAKKSKKQPKKEEVVEEVKADDDVPDSWDADDTEEKAEAEAEAPDAWDDDEWDDSALLATIQQKVEETTLEDEVEDLAELDRLKEQQRLREQGIALAKRQAEMEAEAALQAEAENIRSKAKLEEERKKKEAAERRRVREEEARAAVSEDNLRSPICCIMGHVDTGKTKLLDNIRKTKVQDAEAGGITQQIGATFFPVEAIKQKTAALAKTTNLQYKLPGLLVIDTPGHESFTNLRSRGSSLCDIAILVVDIMHGLEPQTLESLRLLRAKRAPFVVALNKIDRCYSWKTCPDMPIRDALALQNEHVVREFEDRAKKIMVEFAEQGLNAEVYWRNKDLGRTVSLIPTSAITGEGVPDLLMMLTKLTQERMAKSLAFVDILQCTVLEVKVIEGLGTTIDTILVNGSLSEGQTIVVCTLEGPVVSTIRSLLTPHPMKEIRVKGEYVHHQTIKAAMGVKICAQGLEKAVAGTQIHVVGPDDDVEELKDAVMSDLSNIMDSVNATKRGVMVQASTLGALEALLEFLRTCDPPIPVACVNIGPVHKKDVVRASVQLEHNKEYATILAFDVKIQNDANELANELGVRIFTADIIYHLFDQFTAYMDNIKALRREQFADVAVFPVILRIIPTCIFNKKDPIILGVDIEDGILKVGTPLVAIVGGSLVSVGRVGSIEKDNKPTETAKKGASVAVRIESDSNVTYGRHFDHNVKLYSHLSRASIDALKENFKEDLAKDDWRLVIRLKGVFGII
ncbi:eukaryotic translation initiation factor 5B [Achlya hypogyna]|uniref:Eukaryotic translation initiation factor 5B n=1 Tax=Achlya hypogyna TaxID=1202772 RepID=A0A1V9ZHM2_ACHHY|nr:eukaryotic translation initiation factor 5B [Achlya hypogyna]